MNLLITSAGQRVSLVKAFKHEWGKFFSTGKVMTADMNPDLSPACVVSDHSFNVSPVTDKRYIPELLQLCLEQHIAMVVPTIDTELLILAEHKEEFSERNIALIISDTDFVTNCRDKRRISTFFQQHDIDTPKIMDKSKPDFPLFIKPYDGSRSIDTFVINNRDELTAYHHANQKLLFMEYLDKKDYDEFTIDMYYGKDNRVKCMVPRRRIAIRSGEVSKGLTCKNEILPLLKERLNYIRGAVGCITLQMFLHKSNSSVKAIEINPRFGGGYPLSYLAGANFPKWLIEEHLFNREIEYSDEWEDQLLMLRYDDEVLVHGYKP